MIYEELNEPGSHWFKAVATDTGEIGGFVKWQEPKPGVSPSQALGPWPEEADQQLCNETFGAWARMHRDLLGARGHWCKYCVQLWNRHMLLTNRIDLEIVATDPAYQGKGAGSQMMRWGLERADEQGMEAYLEASPDAVPLYEKLGFREAGRTDTWIENERVKGTWYRNLFMIRPAKDKSKDS